MRNLRIATKFDWLAAWQLLCDHIHNSHEMYGDCEIEPLGTIYHEIDAVVIPSITATFKLNSNRLVKCPTSTRCRWHNAWIAFGKHLSNKIDATSGKHKEIYSMLLKDTMPSILESTLPIYGEF